MTFRTLDYMCVMTITSPMKAYTSFTTILSDGDPCYYDGGLIRFANPTVVALDLTISLCSSDSFLRTTSIRNPPVEILSGTAIAHPVWLFWQTSDLTNFPVEYASALASVIKVPFGNTTTTPLEDTPPASTAPSPELHNKGHRLSPGAIAGIAIGIGASVIFSVVIILYLWRRRKQRQPLEHPDVLEMEGSSRGLKHFMGGKWRAETDGTSNPVEAASRSVMIIPGSPVELGSTQRERD